MPRYEYPCAACGERFEILQPLGAGKEGLSCPHCESTRLGKVFSTFAASSSASSSSGPNAAAPSGCGAGSGFT